MTRITVAFLVLGMGMASTTHVGKAVAQETPAASSPDPKMPPMPSMEGQQGDVSKPVTQIPARKKGSTVEKKVAATEKRGLPVFTKPTPPRKKR